MWEINPLQLRVCKPGISKPHRSYKSVELRLAKQPHLAGYTYIGPNHSQKQRAIVSLYSGEEANHPQQFDRQMMCEGNILNGPASNLAVLLQLLR